MKHFELFFYRFKCPHYFLTISYINIFELSRNQNKNIQKYRLMFIIIKIIKIRVKWRFLSKEIFKIFF